MLLSGGGFTNLDDKVDYSTVHISVQEVQKTTNIETVKTPFGEKIKNAIQDSFYNFKIKIENLILYMASNILMLIVYVFTFILGWNFAKKNVKFDRIRKMKKDKNVESK